MTGRRRGGGAVRQVDGRRIASEWWGKANKVLPTVRRARAREREWCRRIEKGDPE